MGTMTDNADHNHGRVPSSSPLSSIADETGDGDANIIPSQSTIIAAAALPVDTMDQDQDGVERDAENEAPTPTRAQPERLSEPAPEPEPAAPSPQLPPVPLASRTRSGGIRKSLPVAQPEATKTMAVTKVKKASPAKRTTPKKKPKWDAETIMIDPKSPLATANLRTMLSNPLAWDVLGADDKAEILALFPDQAHILAADDSGDARPDFGSLMNDDTFRHDCSVYTENVAEGRFDPEWLACAWAAHERRKAGDFDEHLIAKFENDWQTELPDEMKPKRRLLSHPDEAKINQSGGGGDDSGDVDMAEEEANPKQPTQEEPVDMDNGEIKTDERLESGGDIPRDASVLDAQSREDEPMKDDDDIDTAKTEIRVEVEVEVEMDELQATEEQHTLKRKRAVIRQGSVKERHKQESEDELA